MIPESIHIPHCDAARILISQLHAQGEQIIVWGHGEYRSLCRALLPALVADSAYFLMCPAFWQDYPSGGSRISYKRFVAYLQITEGLAAV